MPVSKFFTQSAVVETIIGTGENGDNFAAPVTITCFVDGMQKVSRSSNALRGSDSQEVVTLTGTNLYTWLSNQALFVPDSRVTVNGSVSRVVGVNINDTGRPSVDHVAVNLI